MKAALFAMTLTFSLLNAGLASADESSGTSAGSEGSSEGFGKRGALVVDRVLGFQTRLSGYNGWYGGLIGIGHAEREYQSSGADRAVRTNGTSINLSPSFDYFVSDRWSIGGQVSLSRLHAKTEDGESYGLKSSGETTYRAFLAPRIGYLIPVASGMWLWPRVSGGYGYASGSHPDTWSATVEAPVVFSLHRHLLFAVGPELATSRSSSEGAVDTYRDEFNVDFGVGGGLSLTL